MSSPPSRPARRRSAPVRAGDSPLPAPNPALLSFAEGSAEMGTIEESSRTSTWIQWLLHLDLGSWVAKLEEHDQGGPSWFLGPMVLNWSPHIIGIFDKLFSGYTLPEWFEREEILATLQVFKLVDCEVVSVDQVRAELRNAVSVGVGDNTKLASAVSLPADAGSWDDVMQVFRAMDLNSNWQLFSVKLQQFKLGPRFAVKRPLGMLRAVLSYPHCFRMAESEARMSARRTTMWWWQLVGRLGFLLLLWIWVILPLICKATQSDRSVFTSLMGQRRTSLRWSCVLWPDCLLLGGCLVGQVFASVVRCGSSCRC